MSSEKESSPVLPDNEEQEELDCQNLIDGSIELEDELELTCRICEEKLKEPKVLSCLHAYCEACLEKKVEEELAPVDGEPTKPFCCPVSSF